MCGQEQRYLISTKAEAWKKQYEFKNNNKEKANKQNKNTQDVLSFFYRLQRSDCWASVWPPFFISVVCKPPKQLDVVEIEFYDPFSLIADLVSSYTS